MHGRPRRRCRTNRSETVRASVQRSRRAFRSTWWSSSRRRRSSRCRPRARPWRAWPSDDASPGGSGDSPRRLQLLSEKYCSGPGSGSRSLQPHWRRGLRGPIGLNRTRFSLSGVEKRVWGRAPAKGLFLFLPRIDSVFDPSGPPTPSSNVQSKRPKNVGTLWTGIEEAGALCTSLTESRPEDQC